MSVQNNCCSKSRQLEVPTDADMGGTWGPSGLQAKLGPPPVSPLGVVPKMRKQYH